MKTVLASGVLFLATTVSANCIDVHQEVSGVVVDPSDQPIEGAVIHASWRERGKLKAKTEQSGAQGRFTIYIIFNAYSGSGLLGEDQCDGKFEQFSIGASKSGFVGAAHRLRPSEKPITTRLLLRKVASDG